MSEGAGVVQFIPVAELEPYARNSNTHTEEDVAALAGLIRQFGWTQPILAEDFRKLRAGHRRRRAALLIYAAGERIRLPDGSEIPDGTVPVLNCAGWTENQIRAYVIADNKSAEAPAWDYSVLASEVGHLVAEDFNVDLLGFSELELGEMAERAEIQQQPDPPAGRSKPTPKQKRADAPAPDILSLPVSRKGDVWKCGRHRVACLDCTSESVPALIGHAIDALVTDPPYCSGGFQESGRSVGSVGTKATHKQIANDRLSTRGYMALLRTAFERIDAPFVYAFTDWRMWVNLFDVMESSGYGVRSMIVWDKATPGMGRGWRAQHELVMFAGKSVAPFDGKKSSGNVIQCKRTGNNLHTTEKPVEVLEKILSVHAFAQTVADPFLGSGTTLIACELQERTCFGMELDPHYVDVSVRRWQNVAQGVATLEGDGRTFAEIEKERAGMAPAPVDPAIAARAHDIDMAARAFDAGMQHEEARAA